MKIQQTSVFSFQQIEKILEIIQNKLAQDNLDSQKDRVIQQRMRNIKARIVSPHKKRSFIYEHIDFRNDFYEAQYSAPQKPESNSARKTIAISRSGNGYDMTVLSERGHVLYTSHFPKTDTHKLIEAWKLHTDPHYRNHKQAIQKQYREGVKSSISSINGADHRLTTRTVFSSTSNASIVSILDDVPVLTDDINYAKI